MSAHLQLEIERLKRKLLALSALVEHRIHEAVRALHTRDGTLARGVIDGDSEIDQAEVEVEEECLKILALYQPVASDLRFIGDLAVNIARKALAFAGQTEFQFPFDLVAMSRKTEAMLHDALDCLVHLNADQARAVCERDREINDMKRNLREQAEREMRERPPQIPLLLRLLGACRNLERVADQAANIAEDVVYLVHGEIIRHQPGAGTQRENGE
jgi:phosphate transport system protein